MTPEWNVSGPTRSTSTPSSGPAVAADCQDGVSRAFCPGLWQSSVGLLQNMIDSIKRRWIPVLATLIVAGSAYAAPSALVLRGVDSPHAVGGRSSCGSPPRNPALLAKMAVTVDAVSDGRVVLDLGAAWYDAEYVAVGYATDHRVGRLEEALQIITAP